MPPVVPANKSKEDFVERHNRDLKRANKLFRKNEYGFRYHFYNTWDAIVGSLKKAASKIHWLNYIFGISKKTKTGRFGAKDLQKDDAIERLGEGQGPFFDPFKNMDGEKGFQYSDNEDISELQQAFRSRAYDQKDLARQNDFEYKNYSDDAKALDYMKLIEYDSAKKESEDDLREALEYDVDTLEEKAADEFDLEREFIPDQYKEGEPSKFKMAIQSDNRMQNYFIEVSNRYTSKKSKFFSRTAAQRENEMGAALEYAVKNSPEYREAYARGQAEAKAAGMEYDPAADPNIWMIHDMANPVDFGSNGHARLALRTYAENDEQLSSYSFGFMYGTDRSIGAASVIRGHVQNPDTGDDTNYTVLEPITYRGYLKAAAKIRGIRSSGRTYSTLGYNCTSFVQDIAKEAGVNIPIEDSSAVMMTNISKQHRVDNPYSLALWIKNRNLQKLTDETGTDYIRLAKSPVIQEARGGVSVVLAEMLSDNDTKLKEHKDKFANRWNAMLAKNPAIPEGTRLETILGNIKSLYDDIMLEGLEELSAGRVKKKTISDEQRYLDLVNNKENRLNNRFGTTSIIEYINNVLSTEDGYNHYLRMCEDNAEFINAKVDRNELSEESA